MSTKTSCFKQLVKLRVGLWALFPGTVSQGNGDLIRILIVLEYGWLFLRRGIFFIQEILVVLKETHITFDLLWQFQEIDENLFTSVIGESLSQIGPHLFLL